ncbi:hypothetical protein RJ55_04448 [Drechmeria coniospora]|nr:hypothetical protein RJ55_04448 [Drechmeria coniospora]
MDPSPFTLDERVGNDFFLPFDPFPVLILLSERLLANIAPRPTSGSIENSTNATSHERRKLTKKRGRPSKADMAKRDLKPNLPQFIAPRPPHQMTGYQAILPATSRPQDPPHTVSRAASLTSHSSPSDDLRDKKRRRTGTSNSGLR